LHTEVVAGLVNDGQARDVAAAAVRLARDLGACVRFVQVLPEGLEADDRAEADAATFVAALDALQGRPRVQATFESPSGDPPVVLVARSRRAVGLVVGADRPGGPGEPALVAAYCRAHAGCPVHVVGSADPGP
jgi:nucleotide-binding universal stress UspA family protein